MEVAIIHGAATTVETRSKPDRLVRDLPAVAERVLIIGLDGATFDVLNPMMKAGRMPNLRAFVNQGTSGILESTRPPITPAAWTTFMTGKSPGTHGIMDFERYDVETHKLSFNSYRSVSHVRTIWDILGDKGLKVGVVSVPMTYPPRPVNGFLITGFETPSTEVEFTYPTQLKHDLLRRWPDYTFKTTWDSKPLGGDRVLADNLKRFCRSFHLGAEMTRHYGDQFGWDALMVVFKLVDNLQHKAWKYIDPRFNRKHPERADRVADCFRELDIALGTLFDYAEKNRAAVVIVSDHGHGSLEGKAQPNLLLSQWGYLKLDSPLAQHGVRLQGVWDRMRRKKKGRFANQRQVIQDLAVDFSQTRACVMHAGEYGFVYINLKGRQPCGVVEPRDYERFRDELRERFLGVTVTTPAGETIRVFPDVYKPEELYGCSRQGREWMADLFLRPADGLSVARKIRGAGAVRWLPWRKIEGTHRFEGILIAGGNGIARGRTARAAIVDAAPTVLAMLGIRVPHDMEGRVVTELFESPIETEIERVAADASKSGGEQVFSDDEQKLLSERLADLGYLD